jgi:phosphopantetheinyl transferase
MPVIIDRCSFYDRDPKPGELLDCRVAVHQLDASAVVADVELTRGSRVWCRIDGWEDRRFDTNPRVWEVLRFPEKSCISEEHDAFSSVAPPWRNSASRDLLARRYLNERERAIHSELGPRAKNEWLLGRIALKDAIRRFLWKRGRGDLFPAEIEIDNDASGKPIARGPFEPVEISVAHKEGLAVARAAETALGIDLEKVVPRGADFEAIAFTLHELRLLPEGDDRDECIARFWVAKEAVAKQKGTGLGGNPRAFQIAEREGTGSPSPTHGNQTEINQFRNATPPAAETRLSVRAGGETTVVETVRVGEYVVGWTVP